MAKETKKVLVTRGNVNGTRSMGYKDEHGCGDVLGRDNESWYTFFFTCVIRFELESYQTKRYKYSLFPITSQHYFGPFPCNGLKLEFTQWDTKV